MKTIEFVIDPLGNIRSETKGFTGGECRSASRALETALGLVESDTPTAAAYTATPAQTDARLRS